MENPRLRMGVEVELQGVRMSFQRVGHQDQFWPLPNANVAVDTTMMRHNPVLVPMTLPDTTAAQYTDTLDWEGDWGFIVCGDNYNRRTETLQNSNPAVQVEFGWCIFEVNTSARMIADPQHWVITRAAIRAFRDTLLSFATSANPQQPNGTAHFTNQWLWYPLSDMVTAYNAAIDQLWLQEGWQEDPQRWKLKLSRDLDRFENRNGGGYKGVVGNWEAIVTIERNGAGVYDIWCDSQVNYQAELGYLYEHTDEWIEMWAHMWMHGVQPIPFGQVLRPDPTGGHKNPANMRFVYRNQINAALWRAARDEAKRLVGRYSDPLYGSGLTASQTKALLMMLFAVGSITPDLQGTPKNGYSQFPKTSPASIASKIGGASHAPVLAALRQMLDINMVRSEARDRAIRMRAMNHLRDQLPRGGPHQLRPQNVPIVYRDYNDQIVTDPLCPQFTSMWHGTFSATFGLGAGNQHGYTTAAPYYCYWALAHTAKPAIRYMPSGRIKVLFESRYGHNRLNLGFNPDASEELFYYAYRSLLMLTGPTDIERTNRLAFIKPLSTSVSRKQLRNAVAKGQKKGVH